MAEPLAAGWKLEGPLREPGQRAVRPKSSATLLIIRRDGGARQVLMGRRNAGHKFMPNRWVFPGGRVERGDWRAPFATDLSAGALAVFGAYLRPQLGRALAMAAIRETWEEAGLLLGKAEAAPRHGPPNWRSFLATGVLPDLSAIEVVGRAITPPGVGKRFDTWALVADGERLVTLERQPDCGELDEIAWFAIDEALKLDMPRVTRVFVTEAAARLDEPHRPRPFVRYRQGAVQVDTL
jgi:8-oxo-dGTP pyrophosphatase MutT (NUDIX family)